MTPEEIHELREDWKNFEHARAHGGVSNIPTEKLANIARKMIAANELLAIFPEAETTRHWLALKHAEISDVLFHRKHTSQL